MQTEKTLYLVIHGKPYNVTSFSNKHPYVDPSLFLFLFFLKKKQNK